MVLCVQLDPRLIDGEDQLAVLDPLPGRASDGM
jgi:hypothetical protein